MRNTVWVTKLGTLRSRKEKLSRQQNKISKFQIWYDLWETSNLIYNSQQLFFGDFHWSIFPAPTDFSIFSTFAILCEIFGNHISTFYVLCRSSHFVSVQETDIFQLKSGFKRAISTQILLHLVNISCNFIQGKNYWFLSKLLIENL